MGETLEMKEDKEAQKKITEIIHSSVHRLSFKHDDWELDAEGGAEKILTLMEQLGYHKCENCTYKMVAMARNE